MENDHEKTIMGFTDEKDILTPELLEENSYQCSFIKSIMNICIGTVII